MQLEIEFGNYNYSQAPDGWLESDVIIPPQGSSAVLKESVTIQVVASPVKSELRMADTCQDTLGFPGAVDNSLPTSMGCCEPD